MEIKRVRSDIVSLIECAAAAPRDSRLENELVEKLRQLEAAELAVVLVRMLDLSVPGTYAIAVRVSNSTAASAAFFDEALRRADAQSVRSVLEFGLTKLGTRKAMRAIARRIRDQTSLRDKVMFWLPQLTGRAPDSLKAELDLTD